MKYKGKCNYNMVNIWWMISMKSRYISWGGFFKTYCPTFIILGIAFLIYYLTK